VLGFEATVWILEFAMKVVGSEESGEALHLTSQHMSPPSLARAKMGSITRLGLFVFSAGAPCILPLQ
jgi:hypothetical protein